MLMLLNEVFTPKLFYLRGFLVSWLRTTPFTNVASETNSSMFILNPDGLIVWALSVPPRHGRPKQDKCKKKTKNRMDKYKKGISWHLPQNSSTSCSPHSEADCPSVLLPPDSPNGKHSSLITNHSEHQRSRYKLCKYFQLTTEHKQLRQLETSQFMFVFTATGLVFSWAERHD